MTRRVALRKQGFPGAQNAGLQREALELRKRQIACASEEIQKGRAGQTVGHQAAQSLCG